MSPKTDTKKSNKQSGAAFSAEEKAAMKALIKERKANATKAEAEKAALEAIAAMQEPDRSMAMRFHEIVKSSAPTLSAKTWYGMPAYANEDDNVVCFFQSAQKFKSRYSTFGFSDKANLDEDGLWATGFALKELTATEEKKIAALVKKAVS